MNDIKMDYISHSRLDVFRQCPRSFKLKYVDKLPPENDTYEYFAQYGSLLHYITETWFKNRGFVPKSVLLDMFVNGTKDEDGNDIVGFNSIQFPMFRGKTAMRDKYWNQGLEFIDRLLTYNTSQTIGVEQEFLIKINDDVPPIKGYIDRIDRTANGIEVWDYKTSNAYGQTKCDELPQVGIYSLACRELYGEYASRMIYDFIRVNDRTETYRTEDQLEAVKQDIIDTWYAITTSDWQPKYDSFYCTAFCAYHASCNLYKKMKEQEAIAKAVKKADKQNKETKPNE